MLKPKFNEIVFIGLIIEGFLYGVYSGIFALYFRIQASKKDSNKLRNTIFYSICVLYALSVVVFVGDILMRMYQFNDESADSSLRIVLIQTTSLGCCDFIAQLILIYRCWIMWGCKFRVVIIPTLLAIAFLGTWLASSDSLYVSSNQIAGPSWMSLTSPTSLVLSLIVNALVTGLIVFRILKVFREVKTTSENQILGATGGNKLRRVVLVLIESGMALFSIQLAWLVATVVWTDTAKRAFAVISCIYDMLIGITPTIILVRTSMGLSFHDEKSMEEIAIGSLPFASNNPNSVPEMWSIGVEVRDSRDDDFIEVRQSNDIEVVDR